MHLLLHKLSRIMALLGGIVLILLIVITTLSVIGRSLNTIGHNGFVETNLGFLAPVFTRFGPINGDFELVEAGVAFAILAFFPWCIINRGHATVDIFTSFLPDKPNRFLVFLWEGLFAIVLLVISWRLFVGTSDKLRYGETTFLLQFPVWWGFAACFAASVVAAIVGVYSAWMRGAELIAPAEKVARAEGKER